jgi:penicillin amidase
VSLSRLTKRIFATVLTVAVTAAAIVWTTLRLSLPLLDGDVTLAALGNPVTITRDNLGVPTIIASSRRDLAAATGFLHAQDRFFQMDVLRRVAAGELSELVGPAAVDVDRRHRLHRFRAAATALVERLPDGDRALLSAYADGVNAGLAAMRARPFEYLLLRSTPAPWQIADTLLVNYAMYLDLNDEDASRDATNAALHDALPAEIERFLLPEGTAWDAPLIGDVLDTPPIPGPATCDLSSPLTAARARHAPQPDRTFLNDTPMAGSNAWTVGPDRSATGRAMVANDMHLELRAPNIWYRMRWRVEPQLATERPLDITGVTLPGAPVVVAGSNGSVAWGFTNSYGDWSDLVVIDTAADDPARYRTPDGWRAFDVFDEQIAVRGEAAVMMRIERTIWGPIVDTDLHGRKRAVHWLAHEPAAVNLRLLDLERAGNVDAAIAIAHAVGAAPQNIMLADRAGNTAWTIMGRIPRRQGYDPRWPASWAAPGTGWIGWLDSADYPVLKNPSAGILWTANARTADGAALTHIGRGTYALGARARQIRDRLTGLDHASMADMLAIQLDDQAILLQRWGELLTATLKRAAATDSRAELLAVLAAWDGRATPAAVGYRLTREFRRAVHETLLAQIIVGCGTLGALPTLNRLYQLEGPIWRLVTERPAHFSPAGFGGWDDFLLAQAERAARSCGATPLNECTWGQINRVDIRHPLAGALPFAARWLTINATPLPGGRYMPRVQNGRQGASERFAVSPGDEANGYFHMPGGQSGHPLSPYFRAGHAAWVEGEPAPFLPGPAEHTLILEPTGLAHEARR